MSQQPEALRLADATELRRLHAVESCAKVELLRRDNLIDSLHGLCESYRTQVESLQVEISRLQSAPVAAVPALVPLADYAAYALIDSTESGLSDEEKDDRLNLLRAVERAHKIVFVPAGEWGEA